MARLTERGSHSSSQTFISLPGLTRTEELGSLVTVEVEEVEEVVEVVEVVLSSQVRAGQDPILSSAPCIDCRKVCWLAGREAAGWLAASS